MYILVFVHVGNSVQLIDGILQKDWKLHYLSNFPYAYYTQLPVREPAKFKHINRQWK